MEIIFLILIGTILFLYLAYQNRKLKNALALQREDFLKEQVEKTTRSVFEKDTSLRHTQEIEKLENLLNEKNKEIEALKESFTVEAGVLRNQTQKQVRATMKGLVSEKFAPLLYLNLPLEDFQFSGAPVDYMIFSGLSKINAKLSETLNEIVFLEIKTGNSRLSRSQQKIRQALEAGKIRFCVFNMDDESIKNYYVNQKPYPHAGLTKIDLKKKFQSLEEMIEDRDESSKV